MPSLLEAEAGALAFGTVASFLLWQGPNSYLGVNYCTDPQLPSDPMMDVALGKPTGACEQIGGATYRRAYEHGEVIVNSSATASATVELQAGGTDPYGKHIDAGTKTLAPHGWLVVAR